MAIGRLCKEGVAVGRCELAPQACCEASNNSIAAEFASTCVAGVEAKASALRAPYAAAPILSLEFIAVPVRAEGELHREQGYGIGPGPY